MNLSQLRAFDAVAREGSFTRAAARLGITQPAVTLQVRGLEQGYGVALFHRRGRQVALTELGAALAGITRRLFALDEAAAELLGAARRLTAGTLRVGADGPYDLMPLLAGFRARYPGMRVALSIGNSAEVLHGLLEEDSDVAVLAEVPDDPRLHAVALATHPLVAFVNASHPWARRKAIRLKDLAGQPMVLREPGSTTRRTLEAALAEAGVAPEVVMEIESREAVKEAVAAGIGIGVVSRAEFGNDDRLRALPIAGAKLRNTESIVCLAERRQLRVVAAFLALAETGSARRKM